MSFDFERRVGSLSHADRLLFYELFAHELTIAVRAIWSDDATSDAEKLDRIKWVNEMLHHVVSKVTHVRLGTDDRSEAEMGEMIRHWASQNPAISGHVGYALNQCLGRVFRMRSAQEP
jgi:hypothetical protein